LLLLSGMFVFGWHNLELQWSNALGEILIFHRPKHVPDMILEQGQSFLWRTRKPVVDIMLFLKMAATPLKFQKTINTDTLW